MYKLHCRYNEMKKAVDHFVCVHTIGSKIIRALEIIRI